MKGELYDFYILHHKKYKENSLLVSIFTRDFGKLTAIIRVSKKQTNIFQPLVHLRGEISIAKKESSLSRVYNIDFVEMFYKQSYINLLSLQYMNELMYILLNYSYQDDILFDKYDFILRNISDDNYRHLLRIFELQILESLGQGIYVDVDTNGEDIILDDYYQMVNFDFRKSHANASNSIKGSTLTKINSSPLTWDKDDLRVISGIIRINIDRVLSGKKLQSRKLLIDYLNLK